MIRIGHVLTNIWDGGIERVVLQISQGLPREQFDTTVYALIDNNPWKDVFLAAGIKVKSYHARNRGRILATGPANIGTLVALARDLAHDRIDALNTHDFFPGVLGRTAGILARTPRIYTTLHNTYTWLDRRHGVLNQILAQATDRIIGVSNACVQDSLQRDRISPTRYQVIHNGIDQSRFHPRSDAKNWLLEELGWPADTFLVGNVGTLSPRKDQITLLRAIQHISTLAPNLKLLIVGSRRPHEMHTVQELEEFVVQHSLADRVRFLSDRKDMEKVVAGLDVFSMPSLVEGHPLSLVEAMMSGRPCVVSDIPSIREVVGPDAACAEIHKAGDWESLAHGILRLYGDPDRRSAIGSMGFANSQRFSLGKMLDAYQSLYSCASPT